MTVTDKKKSGRIIRLIMKSYDHRALDKAVLDVLQAPKEDGDIRYSGPIPLPTKTARVTVKKSPNADGDARQQYERRLYRRLIDIDLRSANVDTLKNLDLSAGVEVKIELR